MSNFEKISVSLPKEMVLVMDSMKENGSYSSRSDLVRDAMRLWQKENVISAPLNTETLEGIERGINDIKNGRFKSADMVFNRLEEKYNSVVVK